MFVVLVAGVLLSLTFAFRASREADARRAEAEQRADAERRAFAARDEAETQRDQARLARDNAEAVTEFLVDLLADFDPYEMGGQVTVRAVLNSAAESIGQSFQGQPLVEARLRHIIGRAYLTGVLLA